jgi:predicted phosphoribosyltransferase
MRAAVKALRKYDPEQIIVAVPVASKQTCDEFKTEADVWAICATTPEPFFGVGMWYANFSQTTDDEVQELLAIAEADLNRPTAATKGGTA